MKAPRSFFFSQWAVKQHNHFQEKKMSKTSSEHWTERKSARSQEFLHESHAVLFTRKMQVPQSQQPLIQSQAEKSIFSFPKQRGARSSLLGRETTTEDEREKSCGRSKTLFFSLSLARARTQARTIEERENLAVTRLLDSSGRPGRRGPGVL